MAMTQAGSCCKLLANGRVGDVPEFLASQETRRRQYGSKYPGTFHKRHCL